MPVVANPRAGLVRGANALYLTRRGLVKAVALFGLRPPVGHGKGTGYQRQRIALRKSVHGFGPLGGVGIVEEGSVGHRLDFFLQIVFCVVSLKSNKIRGKAKSAAPRAMGCGWEDPMAIYWSNGLHFRTDLYPLSRPARRNGAVARPERAARRAGPARRRRRRRGGILCRRRRGVALADRGRGGVAERDAEEGTVAAQIVF